MATGYKRQQTIIKKSEYFSPDTRSTLDVQSVRMAEAESLEFLQMRTG